MKRPIFKVLAQNDCWKHHRLTRLSSPAWDCPRVEFSSNQYSTVMTCQHNGESMSGDRFKGALCYLLHSLPVFCFRFLQRTTLDIKRRWGVTITASEQSCVSWIKSFLPLKGHLRGILRCLVRRPFLKCMQTFLYLLKVACTRKLKHHIKNSCSRSTQNCWGYERMSVHSLIWMQSPEDLRGLIPFSTSWISHGYNLLCRWRKWFLFFTSFIIQTLDTNQNASLIEVKAQPFNSILCDFLHLPERIRLNWNWSCFLKRPSKLSDPKKNYFQRSRKNSTQGDKAELSSSILPLTSHALPTSCFFNAVRANVRPQINVMSHWWGKHIDSKGWAGRQMKGDKSGWASRKKRRKDKNVIKDKQEYKKMLEMCSLYLSKKPGIVLFQFWKKNKTFDRNVKWKRIDNKIKDWERRCHSGR